MKQFFALCVILTLSFGATQAQCLSDQMIGKRWVCVGKETNGERIRFDSPYFNLTLETDNRFTKTSFDAGNKRTAADDFTGTYVISDCHLILTSRPRSVAEGVTRRVEEYEVNYNNDHYMTLSVSINGVLTRTYYLVYAGKPDANNFSRK